MTWKRLMMKKKDEDQQRKHRSALRALKNWFWTLDQSLEFIRYWFSLARRCESHFLKLKRQFSIRNFNIFPGISFIWENLQYCLMPAAVPIARSIIYQEEGCHQPLCHGGKVRDHQKMGLFRNGGCYDKPWRKLIFLRGSFTA